MNEGEITAYDRVNIAREIGRRGIFDYIEELFDEFIEMHGDRLFRDDPSIVGGIASFHGRPVTVIGHRKGSSTEENIKYNFGMTSPEGYRKAVRLMREAEKFNRPVITFVDTPGAYPGLEAESNGQSNAIAESIACMSRLKVPTISIITGEGSSGGALAIAMADRVYMLENAVYSILSPEGFATILWKDSKRAAEAAEIMKITANDLYELHLIDGVIMENRRMMASIEEEITKSLEELDKHSSRALIADRLDKYRKFSRIEG